MAITIPVFFMSPLAGWLTDHTGPKFPAVGGLLFSVPFLVLLRIPHANTDNQTSQVVILCVILGLLGTSSLDHSNRRNDFNFRDTSVNV